MPRYLTALPVYNEARHVNVVLDEVVKNAPGDVLCINDGSSDNTAEVLEARGDVKVVHHPENRGYGAALLTAFDYAVRKGYDVLVTIDSDGQHDSRLIPAFFAAAEHAHIVSGSRYLQVFNGNSLPPPERQNINRIVTAELNERFGLHLTDAFCGFKAYRVCALKRLNMTETGYAMPLEFWVKAATAGMKIVELPVPLVYLDEKRTFGGNLDDAQVRLEYYRLTIERAAAEAEPVAADYLSGCGELK
jgi:glycosyltransferase involved in cell wall biosynthesis